MLNTSLCCGINVWLFDVLGRTPVLFCRDYLLEYIAQSVLSSLITSALRQFRSTMFFDPFKIAGVEILRIR